jgi:tripartite-type tricarboxylate transporter receptor subunit TctC
MQRRNFMTLLAVGLLSTAPAEYVAAQLITKTVTIVVPYSAGGGTDTVERLIGHQMSRALGQTVLIENVVGAGGTRANERVAHVALLAAPSLFNDLRYNTETAFEPVGLVNNAPMVLIGRKSIPGRQPRDFIEADRSDLPSDR